MNIKNLVYLGLIITLLTGCSNINKKLTFQDKSYKKVVNESSIILERKKFVMILDKLPKVSKSLRQNCTRELKNEGLSQALNTKIGLHGELRARNIKYISFGKKSNFLLLINPLKYHSNDFNTCKPNRLDFKISLYDIKDLSKNWNGNTRDAIVEFNNSSNYKLVWYKTYSISLKDISLFDNPKEINHILNNIISKDLDKTGLFPKKIMGINQAIIKNQESYKLNRKKQDQRNRLINRSDSLRRLSSLYCSGIKDRLGTGYSRRLKVMCIGDISFSDVIFSNPSQKLSMLNATEVHHISNLRNSICPTIVSSIAEGSKEDKQVSFKYTYKQQILKYFKNQCTIDIIDGINFLVCKKRDKKSYFLESSNIKKGRIYKKLMVQLDGMCFEKFKKHFDGEKIDSSWRTKYGYNKNGFNFRGYNFITDSKYDLQGYDYKNWNNLGINKFTKTKYDKDGYDINGVNKDGTDKDGWNPIQKKFVSKGKKEKYYSFDIIKFDTRMKNKIYNRDYYNSIFYRKTKNGFYLIGKKIYGNKNKPKKIEYYHFRSARGNLLDFTKPKKPLMKESIVLEKIVTKKYDKNGFDQDGYDKDGWNPKLKKFKKIIEL